MWHEERLLVDRGLVPAEGNETYATVDPSTGGPLGSTADACGLEEYLEAKALARPAG